MAEPKNARDIFIDALNCAPAERSAYLDKACAGNEELRQRVEALFQAHDQSGPFLSDDQRHAEATGAYDRPEPRPSENRNPLVEAEGTLIAGKYKLLQQIGEGGMGTVWMADQVEPVKRKVALKLIRVERGQSKMVLPRFEAERQAIAVMDHPHIARLLDAGTTEAGAPFFVMELVKGIPLTDYCDAHKLGIPERLQLFTQVCSAVQHAHQKGIIHRDLKPSNILVEAHDDKPVPKVIDFGLAKATTGLQLTEHTMYTAFGSVMGTPLYMAPEQAQFNAVDVDTRADIYALGVILYELLTGTTPITRETVKKAAFDEMLRIIREQEPPTPSSRLSSVDTAPSVAANRQTEPGKLGRFIRGELDWIVMKALAKSRARRYPTANSLAEDVQRYLRDEPVEACPPSIAYRLTKFTRKHRVGITLMLSVAAALIVGIAATTWQALRATNLEHTAESDRDKAVKAGEETSRLHREAATALNQLRTVQEQQLADQYTWDMQILPIAFEGGNVAEVNRILQRQVPQGNATDRRSYEWHYWNQRVNSHREAVALPMPTEGMQHWAVSSDGSRLARVDAIPSTSMMYLQVWDAETRKLLLTYKEPGAAISFFQPFPLFSGDGQRIAIYYETARAGSGGAAAINQVSVVDIPSRKKILYIREKLRPPPGADMGGLPDAFSPDGKLYVCHDYPTGQRNLKPNRIWELESGNLRFELESGQLPHDGQTFSADGQRLVTYATAKDKEKGRVQFWDTATGKEALAWEIPRGQSSLFAVRPDGKQFALADGSGLKIWVAETGKLLFDVPFDTPLRPRDHLSLMAYSPDGTRLAVLRNLPTREFVPAQNLQATLFDTVNGKLMTSFECSNGPIRSPRIDWTLFSSDSKQLMIPVENEIRTWSALTGQLLQTFRGFEKPVVAAAFSPDSQRVWAVETGGQFKEWDAYPREPWQTPWSMVGLQSLQFFCCQRDGSRFAYLDQDNDSKEYFMQIATPEGRMLKHWAMPPITLPELNIPGQVTSPATQTARFLSMSRAGNRIAMLRGYTYTITRETTAKNLRSNPQIWNELVVLDTDTGAIVFQKAVDSPFERSVALMQDGKNVIVFTRKKDEPSVLHVFDVASRNERLAIPLTADLTSVFEVALSPDGRRLVVTGTHGAPMTSLREMSGEQRHMLLIDLESGAVVATLPHRARIGGDESEHFCKHIAWSNDSTRFANTGVSPKITIHDVNSGAIIATMDTTGIADTSRATFGAPVFSPDGKRVAAMFNPFLESQTKVWDAVTGRELLSIRNQINRDRVNGTSLFGFRALFFSGDGRHLYLAEDRHVLNRFQKDNSRLSITEYP
jgi:serine/threonine protein kinase/WD40 repeat protein